MKNILKLGHYDFFKNADHSIYGEYFNKSSRKKIACPFDTCKKSTCSTYFNSFILDCGTTPTCNILEKKYLELQVNKS